MGSVYTDLRLGHFERPDIEELDANALVDTGAINLCIPKLMADMLQLKTIQMKRVRIADGSFKEVPLVGGVSLSLMGRTTNTTALVLGDQVLLGAIPLEDLDLIVHPGQQRLLPADPTAVTAFVGANAIVD